MGVLADLGKISPKKTDFFCRGFPLQIKAAEYCCNLSLCYLDSETNSTDRFQVTGQGLTFLDRSTFCPGLALASIASLNISNNCLSSLPPLNCLTSLERWRLPFDPWLFYINAGVDRILSLFLLFFMNCQLQTDRWVEPVNAVGKQVVWNISFKHLKQMMKHNETLKKIYIIISLKKVNVVWNKWCLFLCHFYFHFLPRPDNFTTLDTLTFSQPRLSQYFSSDIIICIPNLLPQPASPIVDLPPPRPQPSRLPSANSSPGLTLHQHYTIIMIIIAKITFISLCPHDLPQGHHQHHYSI